MRKDLDGNTLVAIEHFHRQSFFWNYLLNFTGNLHLKGHKMLSSNFEVAQLTLINSNALLLSRYL